MNFEERVSAPTSNTRMRWLVFGILTVVIAVFVWLMGWGILNKEGVTGNSGINRLEGLRQFLVFVLELLSVDALDLHTKRHFCAFVHLE